MFAGTGDVLRTAPHRQRFRHLIKMTSSLFPVARNASLIAHARRQVTHDQSNRQHDAEGEEILHVRDGERAARRNEEQIKADHANKGGKRRWPATIEESDDHHTEQIEHHQVCGIKGGQPLAGDKRCQSAECNGNQTALNLHPPLVFKGAGIGQGRQRPHRRLIEGDHHQIQLRGAFRQPIGKRLPVPPASR